MVPLRVLVAEDNEYVRRMIVEVLSRDFEVIGQVADGQQLIQAAITLQPDVIVSDIVMPIVDGLSARQQLESMSVRLPFVFVTLMELGRIEPEDKGFVGYVHKKDVYTELKPAIRAAAAGAFYVSRSLL
jgi:CheY-like chemotaxis protein